MAFTETEILFLILCVTMFVFAIIALVMKYTTDNAPSARGRMKNIRCLLGFHGEIEREFHVKEADFKKFERVDVNEKCMRCGHNNYLRRVKRSKIVCWTIDPSKIGINHGSIDAIEKPLSTEKN